MKTQSNSIRRSLLLGVIITFLAGTVYTAQTVTRKQWKVKYESGTETLAKGTKVTVSIGSDAISGQAQKGPSFTIPISTITEVSYDTIEKKRTKQGAALMAAAIALLATHSIAQSSRPPTQPANSSMLPSAVAIPRTAIVISLYSPDFTVQRLKYRVFYNKGETRKIPLIDYDFKAAFTDELMNALTAETRMQWSVYKSETPVDVIGVMKKKVAPPEVDAERILLVNLGEFGAFIADRMPDKFYMLAGFKLIDRATGKKLWEKGFYERQDLDGKLEELQADNQKGLKIGINKVLEKVCKQAVEELMKKPIP